MSCQFRDPIHGFIEVSDLELKIINSPPFQRLRNIRQLGTSYLVYHGAEHTRFGHSLGVMHLVTSAFSNALENYAVAHGSQLFEPIRAEWYKQLLRLIALTHDLGHPPFSHASENLFNVGIEHENYTRMIIFETEIAEHIRRIGEDFKTKYGVGDEYAITPEILWLIYGEENELHPSYVMPDFKFLKSFMDSELDCDKMDYLLRDSYYCGVSYGKYDINRLISSLSVYCKTEEHIMQIAIKKGGIQAFEEFVIARYFMFIQVYFHKTRRYLDKLLTDSISSILPSSKYPATVSEFLKWDDPTVLVKINEAAENNSELATKFVQRKVMTCVYETKPHNDGGSDLTLFRLIRKELKQKLDCDIFEDEASKAPHKIPPLDEYDATSGKGIPILMGYMDRPSSISAESMLLHSLVRAINIRRLYVDKEHAIEAKQLVSKMIE